MLWMPRRALLLPDLDCCQGTMKVGRPSKTISRGGLGLRLRFILLPAIARNRYRILLNNQINFESSSESSPYNKYLEGENNSLGIIACGISYNYLIENFENHKCPYPIVKIGQYPVPKSIVNKLKSE